MTSRNSSSGYSINFLPTQLTFLLLLVLLPALPVLDGFIVLQQPMQLLQLDRILQNLLSAFDFLLFDGHQRILHQLPSNVHLFCALQAFVLPNREWDALMLHMVLRLGDSNARAGLLLGVQLFEVLVHRTAQQILFSVDLRALVHPLQLPIAIAVVRNEARFLGDTFQLFAVALLVDFVLQFGQLALFSRIRLFRFPNALLILEGVRMPRLFCVLNQIKEKYINSTTGFMFKICLPNHLPP